MSAPSTHPEEPGGRPTDLTEAAPLSPLFLTIPQAASLLGMGRTYTYERVLLGELPSVHLGRARRIPAAAVEEFAARIIAEQIGP